MHTEPESASASERPTEAHNISCLVASSSNSATNSQEHVQSSPSSSFSTGSSLSLLSLTPTSASPLSAQESCSPSPTSVLGEVQEELDKLGYNVDVLGVCQASMIAECQVGISVEGECPMITGGHTAGRQKSWPLNYSALSFLMNGQLYAEYSQISSMLGLPHCSERHWIDIIGWLEEHVTKITQWSCTQVLQSVQERGDKEAWVTSFDGYYLTRGHYSNNSSATLHDYFTGRIAYFKHRTKRGAGHNWDGTSGGAEADMFDEILTEVKEAGYTIKKIVTDRQGFVHERHLLQAFS